jgi:hypothetical protein
MEGPIMKLAASIIEISISILLCQHFMLERDIFHHGNQALHHGNLSLHDGNLDLHGEANALHHGNYKLHHGMMKFHDGDEALLFALMSFQDDVDNT